MARAFEEQRGTARASWNVAAFEDRYGEGAYQRLLNLLAQPCATYASIGQRFDVTRERVRQWHLELDPEAPRGHLRQRQCWILQQKRRLFDDPLFRGFYQHARPHFAPSRFVLIEGRDGFRKRAVRLDGRTIALKAARPLRGRPGRPPSGWSLAGSAKGADFIYYRLGDDEYLFVPGDAIPAAGETVAEAATSKFRPYWNSFAAVLPEADRQAS